MDASTGNTGGLPSSTHGKWGATSRTGESHPHDMEFLQKNIAEAKQRSTPILGLDLNSGLGLKGASEQVEEPFVGDLHRGEQKLAGHEMENLLRNTDSTSITTMFPESGPTYFSPQGTSRTLDHRVGPVGIHHIVEECRVLWKRAHSCRTSTRPPANSVDTEMHSAAGIDSTGGD